MVIKKQEKMTEVMKKEMKMLSYKAWMMNIRKIEAAVYTNPTVVER